MTSIYTKYDKYDDKIDLEARVLLIFGNFLNFANPDKSG